MEKVAWTEASAIEYLVHIEKSLFGTVHFSLQWGIAQLYYTNAVLHKIEQSDLYPISWPVRAYTSAFNCCLVIRYSFVPHY